MKNLNNQANLKIQITNKFIMKYFFLKMKFVFLEI